MKSLSNYDKKSKQDKSENKMLKLLKRIFLTQELFKLDLK
jgi:hypothetical protein